MSTLPTGKHPPVDYNESDVQPRPGDYSEGDLQIVLGIAPADFTRLVSSGQLPGPAYVWRKTRYWHQDAVVAHTRRHSIEQAARTQLRGEADQMRRAQR